MSLCAGSCGNANQNLTVSCAIFCAPHSEQARGKLNSTTPTEHVFHHSGFPFAFENHPKSLSISFAFRLPHCWQHSRSSWEFQIVHDCEVAVLQLVPCLLLHDLDKCFLSGSCVALCKHIVSWSGLALHATIIESCISSSEFPGHVACRENNSRSASLDVVV
jgi:hypothetical protein